MDEIRSDLTSLARLVSQSHPTELLDALPPLLESVVDRFDVGLYDLQRRRLMSLRTGDPIDADQWPVSVALEHHGNHLGRLLAQVSADDEGLLQLTGPVLRDDATLMIAHRSGHT